MRRISTKFAILITFLLAGHVLVSNAWAQVDYSGVWDLTTSTYIPDLDTMEPCEYTGTALIVQNGDILKGTASLTLVSGPGACPSEMTAEVSGQVDGEDIEWGLLLDQQLGEATFYTKGSRLDAAADGPAADPAPMSLAGGFDVTQGPYAGQSGNWTAAFAMVIESTQVPTLAFYGLLLPVAVLLSVGFVRFRRV